VTREEVSPPSRARQHTRAKRGKTFSHDLETIDPPDFVARPTGPRPVRERLSPHALARWTRNLPVNRGLAGVWIYFRSRTTVPVSPENLKPTSYKSYLPRPGTVLIAWLRSLLLVSSNLQWAYSGFLRLVGRCSMVGHGLAPHRWLSPAAISSLAR